MINQAESMERALILGLVSAKKLQALLTTHIYGSRTVNETQMCTGNWHFSEWKSLTGNIKKYSLVQTHSIPFCQTPFCAVEATLHVQSAEPNVTSNTQQTLFKRPINR